MAAAITAREKSSRAELKDGGRDGGRKGEKGALNKREGARKKRRRREKQGAYSRLLATAPLLASLTCGLASWITMTTHWGWVVDTWRELSWLLWSDRALS